MKGKIEIICDDKGVHLAVQVEGTRDSDRVFLVHALGKALKLEPHDYMVLAMAESEGILDDAGKPMAITIDTDELLKQLKEEHNES